MPDEMTNCANCGVAILQATADRTGGLCMPCKKNPEGAENRAAAQKRTMDSSSKLSKADEWLEIVGYVRRKAELNGVEALTAEERNIDLLWSLDALIRCSGLRHFFDEGISCEFPAILEALNQIGAPDMAAILESMKIVALGDAPFPNPDDLEDAEFAWVEEHWGGDSDAQWAEMDRIDDESRTIQDSFFKRLKRYILAYGTAAGLLATAE